MEDFKNIKERILTDDKVANAVEYLLSKVVLNQRLPQLKFFYKKHKIILGKNGLYSIYKPSGEKLYNRIHYQEVAKYIIDNLKEYGNITNIRFLEDELFRYKEKIEFFESYNNKVSIDIIDTKLQLMYDYYYKTKDTLIKTLNHYKQY